MSKINMNLKKFTRKTKSIEDKAMEQEDYDAVEVPDLFNGTEAKPGWEREYLKDGANKHARELNLFQLEWAIRYPHLGPKTYLTDIKNVPIKSAIKMIVTSGGQGAWSAVRADIIDKMTETTVRKYTELIEATQKIHIDASKMGVDKAVEYLSAMEIRDENGNIAKRFANDLLNIMSAIEKAQAIYRKAVGISDETDVSKLINVFQSNIQLNGGEVSVNTVPQGFTEMDYAEIRAIIKLKKERTIDVVVEKETDSDNNNL